MDRVKKYEFSFELFERFRKLINDTSGIFFDRGKWDVLRLGLSERARQTGKDSLGEYYDFLTSEENRDEELRRLLEQVSVQETQFFRNVPQFDALKKYVIPEIVKRKTGGPRNIRIWSAGCSTGQEVYSLAMAILDVVPDIDSWNVRILGTDLNEQALNVARKGWYPEKKLIGLETQQLDKYFLTCDGGYRVSDNVKEIVTFERLNLVTDPLPIDKIGVCDVIFCRNVIIYFTHETAKYVIEHFFDILNPGGYLFLGHSETLWKMSNKYSLVEMGEAFIYKKAMPRGITSRRFIKDRRMRKEALPPGIEKDRRVGRDRRNEREAEPGRGAKGTAARAREWKKAEAEVVAEEGTEEKTDLMIQAREYHKRGEYGSSAETIYKYLETDSTNADSYFLLGLTLEKQDELDGAAQAFRKAIYCDDRHSLAYFHLANVLERNGRKKEAVREYRNASRLLREDAGDRWEGELGDYDIDSLVELCDLKVSNLSNVEV